MELLTQQEIILPLIVAFLLGGFVKGIIGTGLPTIALALLTATIGLREGMAIILLPSILTNIRQGLFGSHLKVILKRSWSFYLATFCAIWIGAYLLKRVDVTWLSGLLGMILLSYSGVGLIGRRLMIKPGKTAELWLNPIIGGVNGVLTGLTGSSVIPGVLFLQSLELGRDKLIQTMGLLFLISTTTLAIAMQKNALLTKELLMLSAFAFVPSYIGMSIGERIRKKISEELFRRLFFVFMLMLGLYIVIRSLV